MSDPKLAGAAWSWVGASLQESADIWRALGVQAMDLISAVNGDLDPRELEKDQQGHARRVLVPGMALSNLLLIFGVDFDDRAVNSPDTAVRDQNKETLKSALEFCSAAGIPSVCILPGIDQEGMSRADSMKLSADTMSELSSLGNEAGIKVLFEPHLESVFESPVETLAMLQEYDVLSIALDHSHFMAAKFEQKDIDPLIPYAGHVHLRQGKQEALQAKWEESEIEYKSVIQQLKETGYVGDLTLEYENDPWVPLVDVMTETIKMRDTIRSLL